jgi:hypothetical protein
MPTAGTIDRGDIRLLAGHNHHRAAAAGVSYTVNDVRIIVAAVQIRQ